MRPPLKAFQIANIDTYWPLIVLVIKSGGLPSKQYRVFIRQILNNNENQSIIMHGCEKICEERITDETILNAHMDILSRRRNPRAAKIICQYILKRSAELPHSTLISAKVLLSQTLIREGQASAAEDIIEQTFLENSENGALNALKSWYFFQKGDIRESQSLFEKSNAKHIDAINDNRPPPHSVRPIDLHAGAIKIFLTTNNEMEFIESFLKHYRKIGKVQFIVIDNDSHDGTVDFLMSQDDVYLLSTQDSFSAAHFGSSWINHVSKKLSSNEELCLRVDADELLIYPGFEDISLNEFLSIAEKDKVDIISGPLVDMYPEDISFSTRSFSENGAEVLNKCIYFDAHIETELDFFPPYRIDRGGIRRRIFSGPTYLTKTPIFRGGGSIQYLSANHTTTPGRLAPYSCCLLHYKFTPGAVQKYLTQINRGEHFNAGGRYRRFIELIRGGKSDIRGPKTTEYKDSKSLVKSGFLSPAMHARNVNSISTYKECAHHEAREPKPSNKVSDDFIRELPRHRLDFSNRGSTLVISFDNAGAPHRESPDRRPWGYKFFTGEGHSVLGVIARESDWYRCPSLHNELSRLKISGFFDQFEDIVLTGSSMGGYAATAFASLVPGCRVVSFNPQSTLSRALVPWDTNHPTGERQDWIGPFCDGAAEVSQAALAYIIYDPFHTDDSRHAARYQGENIRKLHAPFLGHGLPDAFLEMGILKEIMRRGIKGTLTNQVFYSLIRARKLTSKYHKRLLTEAALRDHSKWALDIAEQAKEKFQDGYFLQREAALQAYQGNLPKALSLLDRGVPRKATRLRKGT